MLGLGNPLMGDDGVGLEALRELRDRYDLPDGVDVADGGTGGIRLLDRVAGFEALLVADCVRGGREPGTVWRLGAGEVGAVLSPALSSHEGGLSDLLAALGLLGRRPSRLTLFGVEPLRLEPGLGLSSPVRAALPLLADAIAEELRAWGFPARRRRPRRSRPA